MSTKRSKLFAASPTIVGGGRGGKEYRNVGPLPTFGADKDKLKAPSSRPHKSSKLQAPKAEGSVAPLKAKGPGLVARSFARLKGLFGRKSTSAAIPKFAQQPVQGELSLDNVKVKCNDLSDTDFELVAKPVPTRKTAPAGPDEVKPATTAPVAESGTRIWNRVTTLLGAGQS